MAQDNIVCIVDDDEAVRDSLLILLETMGFAAQAFASGLAFLDACETLAAGCALLDVRMPKMSGLEVQDRLQTILPNLPVIILTGHGDVTMAVQAMRAGAVDFIEKPFEEEALLTSVNYALSLADRAQRKNEITETVRQGIARLTPREQEVFELLVVGHTSEVIARALDCSPRTVEIHRARVMKKMEASSVAQLVRMVIAAGIEITDG
jgi:two-component system response regulator FixJ